MKNALPKGPIGFKVYGIGWVSGNPQVHAEVGVGGVSEVMEFNRRLGEWFTGDNRLNEEEKSMLDKIWQDECKKMGVPLEQHRDDG